MENIANGTLDTKESLLETVRNMEAQISQFNDRMESIVSLADDLTNKKKIEHFQNQFIIQENRLDEMKHNIKLPGANLVHGKEELDEYAGYFSEIVSEFEGFVSQFEN